MTITIQTIEQARGYTACDHLLDDRPLDGFVGRRFPSPGAAARVAGRALRHTQDRRCVGAPIAITWVDHDGAMGGGTYWADGHHA